MPNFDYISAREFRESLEADHKEMVDCSEAGAWKSVQVLAGSIVEALLVDYLCSTPNPLRSTKDPLKMDLSEAVSIGRAEGVLSDRTADLCSVVRSYRNLIHPGRIIRQGEAHPDRDSADIALALVNIIATEIAKFRRAAVGLTADQVLSKIQRDENAISILRHLLPEVSESQRERLLRDVIPRAYMDINRDPDPFNDMDVRLKKAHRVLFEASSDDIKKLMMSDFVEILRSGDGATVEAHGNAFITPADLAFVNEQHRDMVKEYLLRRVAAPLNFVTLPLLEGMGKQLEADDAGAWLDPIVQTITAKSSTLPIKKAARATFAKEVQFTSPSVDAALLQRFNDWIAHFDSTDSKENAETMRGLKNDLESVAFLFFGEDEEASQ